jgi:hypothetical protein
MIIAPSDSLGPQNGSPRTASHWRRFASRVLCLGACSVLAGCGTDDASSQEQYWTGGMGPLRGHEEILRYGIEMANAQIATTLGVQNFYPVMPAGESCSSPTNPLTQGNCATDSPTEELIAYYGVSKSAWQTDGTIMDLHFLRNHLSTTQVVSAYEGCVTSTDQILEASYNGVALWRDGWSSEGLFWLGHATHTVQDSFSPAHASRSGAGLYALTDVCTYGIELRGVCYHSKVSTGDRVWGGSLGCQWNPFNRTFNCLIPEAQQAALATAGYLVAMAEALVDSTRDPEVLGEDLFLNDATWNGGFFDCSYL